MVPLHRVGRYTIQLPNRPEIVATATVVGPQEAQGPLADDFDIQKSDRLLGQSSWEHAESHMLQEATKTAIKKAGLQPEDIDLLFAGDLLDQITSSSFAARELYIPFVGLYGACSTMAEALAVGSVFVDGGYAKYVLSAASSHHDSAERQYRYPTEFGAQVVPSAQWTVTGAGAALLAPGGQTPRPSPAVTHVTLGRVVDLGIKDSSDMGSAMAPAAVQTILQHYEDLGLGVDHYDVVATGDLAAVGHEIAAMLLKEGGLDLGARYVDCGLLIFDREKQNVKAGGSGCGCSGVVFCGHFMRRLIQGDISRMLLVSTGALLSPTTYQQGDTIPSIAHAVAIEAQGAAAR